MLRILTAKKRAFLRSRFIIPVLRHFGRNDRIRTLLADECCAFLLQRNGCFLGRGSSFLSFDTLVGMTGFELCLQTNAAHSYCKETKRFLGRGSSFLSFDTLVGMTGFEPATSCSQSTRATNCATSRNCFLIYLVPLSVARYACIPVCLCVAKRRLDTLGWLYSQRETSLRRK